MFCQNHYNIIVSPSRSGLITHQDFHTEDPGSIFRENPIRIGCDRPCLPQNRIFGFLSSLILDSIYVVYCLVYCSKLKPGNGHPPHALNMSSEMNEL